MRKALIIFAAVALCSSVVAQHYTTTLNSKTGIRLFSKEVPRREIILPKINGYTLYKADFHVHTIYSDGEVTPRERIREAWYDGLDIIAITDHLEIRTYEKFMLKALAPYNKDGKPYTNANAGAGNKKDKDAPMLSNLNAGYEEALHIIEKEDIPILAVRGTEIWRNPRTTGEYNALFLKDINAICHKDLFECFRRVKEQGGLIMHNHPGWRRKTMDKSEDQIRAYGEGWVDGVECVNSSTLYPTTIRRCIDEKLFIAANTDTHRPASQIFSRDKEYFRTMTFIMAKECTEKAIKEALLKRRTIGYSGNHLFGEEKYLVEFLNEAIDCQIVSDNEKKGHRAYLLTNKCSIPFLLRRGNSIYKLAPFQSLRVTYGKDKNTGKYRLPKFTVDNMWHIDEKHPNIEVKVDK